MADVTTPLAYIGPIGAGLGFKLAGIEVAGCASPEQLLRTLRTFKETGEFKLIFVDEGLAAPILAEVERINEDPVPAIVLLPNPANPMNVAQEKMRNLMIKAVGSDIFGD